ncbi:hypothetical protein [Deinococcus sp. 23YEL01]|uniref:hypothetical protein n=1 Tax=Deinococcus sp. 23YEL01 TaxID=2745871 RepID=UPI001E567EA0|nr:hypothetical protein [Deinococcus sp. 23YEL01]MCD0168968.1 hypothetical protein [Deinococcus sp. 23YEL01]
MLNRENSAMPRLPGVRVFSSVLFAASVLAGYAPAQAATTNMTPPVQVFIPSALVATTSGPSLTVKVKGLETPGRNLSTAICKIRYTVFDLQGKALLMYPNSQTICAEVLLSVNTKRSVWQQFPLDLGQIRKAGVTPGNYLLSVHVVMSENQRGESRDLPIVVSNTAKLQVK